MVYELAQFKYKYLLSVPCVPEIMLNTVNMKMEKILTRHPQEKSSLVEDTQLRNYHRTETLPL